MRQSDDVCRTGGEEFAIILPSGDLEIAHALAERVAERVALAEFDPVGPADASRSGSPLGPDHAANPRELVACAELAMMTAKARGKSRIVVFHEDESERPGLADRTAATTIRSIAHLKMLHGVSSKLSRLLEVDEIGATIADELRQLIDYHNCRVFLRDGDDLRPVAFRGDLTQGAESALDVLVTKVGVGVTGHVAATGEPFLTGDAANCGIGHHIEGTARIEESLLAVPLRYGANVVGVLVISKLGLDQFDADDLRLLEVLAGHASVALVNAQLYEAQRREAEGAKALLELSRELSSGTQLDEVVERIARGAARILGAPRASVWLPAERRRRARVPQRLARRRRRRRSARPGDRLPAAASRALLAAAPSRSSSAARTTSSLVGHDFAGDARRRVRRRPDHARRRLGSARARARQRRRPRRAPARAARRHRRPGEAGAHERALLREPRADVPLHRRGARERARGEGRVHVVTRPLDHATWRSGSARSSASTPATLKRVELGALFHDIGKIGIPAAILTKPGPLTDEERVLIETHPELGERILAPIEQLEHVRPIVRACHERFDGKGYPDRLEGDEIPLEARIIFVCDAFHAMTTTRPYREALPVEEARRRLIEAAGSQFDPAIVDVCLRVLEAPDGEPATGASCGRRRGPSRRGAAAAASAPRPRPRPHRHLPGARLELGLGGRELERPPPAEARRRQPERQRVLPGVEEDEERVVDDRLALARLGHRSRPR